MPTIVDAVHGRALYIQHIHTRILFSTPADALLASFIVKYSGVPLELFDDLLAILHHPEFSAMDISMARAEDFMEHIAEQRRNLARERGMLQVGRIGGIPQLIVELVVDQLHSERIPFFQMVGHRSDYSICEAEDTLKTMILVHRSWATIAQRCLRRRIHALSNPKLRSLLQTPLLGPWVSELCIRLPSSSETHRDGPLADDFHPKDSLRLLCSIIRRCPYLKVLYIAAFNRERVTGSMNISYEFFEHLSRLQYLERLWLHRRHAVGESEIDIGEVCFVLPHLRSLKRLSLDGWYPHSSKEVDAKASNRYSYLPLARSHSLTLKALSLVGVSNSNLLAWLGENCKEYPPDALELSFRDIRSQPDNPKFSDPLPFLAPVIPFVTKLLLYGYDPNDDILSVLDEFPSLHSICIYLYNVEEMPDDSFDMPMPSSIQNVHFHFKYPPIGNQECYVLSTLRVSSHIRRLVITYNDMYYSESESIPDSEEVFREIREYCRENRVEFVVEMVDERPSYLDI